MRRALNMLDDPKIDKKTKMEVVGDIRSIFMQRPRAPRGGHADRVFIENEEMCGFDLSHWLELHNEFKSKWAHWL